MFDAYTFQVCIVEELNKFSRSLRKFRKAAIADNGIDDHIHRLDQRPYKRIDDDRFEHYMRDFARRGQLSCESLFDLHREAVCFVVCTFVFDFI